MVTRLTRIGLILGVFLGAPTVVHSHDATPAQQDSADVPQLVDTREVSVEGRLISMSPDGSWFAVYANDADALCAHAVSAPDQAHACASFQNNEIHSIALDYLRWSPDGSRLAFTEEGPLYLVDADIWVFTADTGGIVNLTDDGVFGNLPLFDDDLSVPFSMDILPAWSPDGSQIAFARSDWDGDWLGTRLMRLPADGSDTATEVALVDPDMPMIVYFGMDFAPDGDTLYFTIGHPDPDEPRNGVWKVALTSGDSRQLAGRTDPERGYPTVQEVSPLGETILVYDMLYAGRFGNIGSAYGLLTVGDASVEPLVVSESEPEGRQATKLVNPTRATYSPDGHWIVFAQSGVRVASNAIVIRPAGNAGPSADSILLGDLDRLPGAVIAITWATNGLVFLHDTPDSGLILEVAGGNQSPANVSDATPAATPVPAIIEGPIDPTTVSAGTSLVVNDAVAALHSAPGAATPVVAKLSGGAIVTALGPAESADGFLWIPVRDEASSTIGYVRADLVSAAPLT